MVELVSCGIDEDGFYEIELYFDPTTVDIVIQQLLVREWCYENIETYHVYITTSFSLTILLRTMEDVIAFKLKWI